MSTLSKIRFLPSLGISIAFFVFLGKLDSGAEPAAQKKLGCLSAEEVRVSTQKAMVADALKMLANGAFQGFHAAPGSSLAGKDSLYDFLVQNVAVDANDHVIDGNPLTAEHQRDVRPGEAIPYFICDYPHEGETSTDLQHRYAISFAQGSDQTGAKYPITLGLREMTPTLKSQEYNTFGPRDIASMVAIFPGFGCYMGAFIPKKDGYVVSVGPGYADHSVEGAARFAHPLYPDPMPALGSLWYATVLQKTVPVGTSKDIDAFPAHAKNKLVPQLTIGKRLMYTYGTRTTQTKPLDTVVVVLAYNNVNSTGDAPQIGNKSTQIERIYLTKELGYATRWDSWAREDSDQKDVIPTAQRAYAYNNCGLPASMEGKYSEHFSIGPVIDDKAQHVYKMEKTITDPETGKKETSTWYMIGAHDYTNLQSQKPFDPDKILNQATIGAGYMKMFGVSPDPAASANK